MVGLRDGVSEAGSPHPLWRGRNQPAGGLSTHARSGEDGRGNEVKALSVPPWTLTWWWRREGEAWEATSCWSEEKAGLVGVWCEHRTADKSLDQGIVRGSAGRPPNRLAQGRTCLAKS